METHLKYHSVYIYIAYHHSLKIDILRLVRTCYRETSYEMVVVQVQDAHARVLPNSITDYCRTFPFT